ncbi:hypothetical protein DCAR_0934502 [Daucus carota subsp. sativus]|uniref:non-specific serine/threonine protein kinase n=1 Tax=Daucus carota subsp. sativus TaxID=79200 RepID=A0AAF0XX15_DAUCS|nr:PREDICTED: receptor-like protein kinase HAIKU2 [Daucus carota subsp. sativus]WOH14972.1 hypothetical protein DCAR_0934502 [Daucus carota subsp. sativus]
MASMFSGHRSIVIVLFSVLCMAFHACSDELDMLLQIKASLKDSDSRVLDTWRAEDSVCSFSGIMCNDKQKVQEINLSQENLAGTLPFDVICSLDSLEKLSLGSNFLSGKISDHLANCTKLTYLDLGNNSFSGEVPDLSSLTRLSFLSLNCSGVSGSFPWSSLRNLTALTFLSLGDNLFEKSPFPLEILNLDKLYWLYLTNSSIEGQIPEEIENLSLLENLELSDNFLFGKIPEGITKLAKLSQLELYDNNLSGNFPEGFGNLTTLRKLDVSNNSLEGDISVLKSLVNLESLQLFENKFSGEIPGEFGEFEFFQELSLYTNQFTGSLPQKIGSWSDFIYIDVSENLFTGLIPPDMCKKGSLTDLLLLQNNFTGGIPETYANCSSLTRVRVSKNSLSGSVPDGLWGLPNVNLMDLSMNQFEGSVTSNLREAKSLSQLFLSNNKFSGMLPVMMSDASSLVEIELGWNNFSGEIPSTLGELKNLSSLHLEANSFTGAIPESLGSCLSLNDISLSGNSLSSGIPYSLGSLPSLNSLNLSHNKLSGKVPLSLSSTRLSLLDLSNNQLSGPIPDALSVEVFSDGFLGNPGLCSNKRISGLKSCSSPGSTESAQLKIIVSIVIAGAFVAILSLATFLYVMKSKKNGQNCPMTRRDSWDMKHYHVLSFSEEEVVKALKQENLIGTGGSGNVYKVPLSCGKTLAVKHVWKSNSGGHKGFQMSSPMLGKGKSGSPEYDAEVEALSSIRHVNVVKLYCSITSEDSNLLVYEYMPNGSLWDQLHTCQKISMDWSVRYDIAVGAARGLEYLHHGYDRPVIHRDVKSSNILLDENMKPRIADFGLAKIVQPNGAKVAATQMIAGTYGYIAPEYAYTYKVDEKSDIYSFGVVLMELVTGKRPTEPEFGENKDIVQWVCDSMMRSDDSGIGLVDSTISEESKEDAARVLTIAIRCTMKVPNLRPSMRVVVQMLEEVEPFKLSEIVVSKDGENCKQ